MKENFDKSLNYVLECEGGFVNDPSDSGGATNKGITLLTYRSMRPSATVYDLKNIQPQEVAEIYHNNYWMAAGCDILPLGEDYVVFDTAVNQGVNTANKMMEAIRRHGKIASETAIDMMCDWRRNRYRNLAERRPLDEKFLNGWMHRVNFVQLNARKMAEDSATHEGELNA